MKLITQIAIRIKLTAILLISIVLLAQTAYGNEDLTFTTWTGPYMRSQMLGFVNPYQASTGNSVNVEHYAGGLDEIRNQVESANVKWDVVDLTQADSLRACNEGLLEEFDHSILPNGTDGSSYKDDFIDGALNPCGVGVIVWATIFAYDTQVYTENKPGKIADFFDIKSFPGRRGIRKDPAVIMEWALMADGVAGNDVYHILETEEGLERAFNKLNKIKSSIVWWENGRDPINMINNREVTMSSVWATTGVEGSKEPNSHLAVEWDGRAIEMDLFGIVKGSPRQKLAKDFVRFASSSGSLAEQAKFLANGPTRKSSLSLIPTQVRKNLPNAPLHDEKASITSDAQWWADNYVVIAEKFSAWAAEASMKGASGTVR